MCSRVTSKSSSRAARVIVSRSKKKPPNKNTKQNSQSRLKLRFFKPVFFFSLIMCYHWILTDDLKEVLKPCQLYNIPFLQSTMPWLLLTVQHNFSKLSFHSPSRLASQATSCSPNRINTSIFPKLDFKKPSGFWSALQMFQKRVWCPIKVPQLLLRENCGYWLGFVTDQSLLLPCFGLNYDPWTRRRHWQLPGRRWLSLLLLEYTKEEEKA